MTTKQRVERRKTRLRRDCLRRLESLEDRTMLNASIDINAASLLTYTTDNAAVENLQVSVSGNVYTFSSNQNIDVVTNVPGLVVTNPGTPLVTVTGITGLAVDAGFANDSVRVASTNVPTAITATASDARVDLGSAGVTAGVVSQVTLLAPGGPVDVSVDNGSGAAADAWNLAAQPLPSTLSVLTGFSTTGSLHYDPAQVHSLDLSTAANQSNRLTIDFNNGSPLPTGGVSPLLNYSGGSLTGTPSDLVLTGTPPTGPIGTETHDAFCACSGDISFGAAGTVAYNNISPHSIYDTVAATNYVFNDTADPDGRVSVGVGANSALTGNLQTLLISSQAATPSFIDTHVANKTNVRINASNGVNNIETTVNYGIATPVAGLSTLTVATNLGPDAARLFTLPPGVTTNIQQGNGDDRAYVTIPGTAGTPGTNLDGGLGYDVLNIDAGGLPIGPGNFGPGVGGSTLIAGAPLPGGPISYVNYEQVNVTNLAAVSPVVTASTIHAVQGQRLVDVVAGTFTSAAPGAKAGDFASTIQWGDGSQSAGVIVQDASNPSVFYVMGTHTYYEISPALTTPTAVTVVSTGGTFTQIINGVPVTFTTPASDPVTANGTYVIDNAPISLTAGSFSGFENITPNPLDVFVATFTDFGGVNPADPSPVSHYTASINWGDGTTTAPSAIVRNGTSNSYTITAPQHVYSTPGSYVVTVTVSDDDPIPVITTATGVATIADAPLTSAMVQMLIPPATAGVQITDARLTSFDDANPKSFGYEFTVLIDWGDGSPMSYGSLVQPGGVGTTYTVVGTHTYADALRAGAPPVAWGPGPIAGPLTAVGTYPIRIFVQDTYGSAVNLTTTITVNDNPLTLGGKLNPLSDSGVSNSDGITNVNQPNFQGSTSEGGALVYVYATPTGGAPMLIGRTTADANGAWSVTSTSALADGGYVIQAQAYDATGHTVSALTTVTPSLVIDTVGPKITNLVFDNLGGQVIATFQDFGGVNGAGVGLNFATIVDANNYRFALIKSAVRGYKPPVQWIVGGIAVQPGTTVGPQTAAIKINDGRGIRGGRYLFTVKSVDPANLTGIQDLAGNALDGEFYSFFPSGNNHVGGDFVAELDAVHHRVYAPKTTVGTASPVTPPGARGVDRFIARNPKPLPTAAAAVRLSTARLTAARTSTLAPRALLRVR
ncbi:MAG: Ig-like domain-containing protein [Paludisphaera borealis]|uniref:Ig-like domain-containing protein n=1 Tax=Paludisphaera borealis TaxID=1387353 RepID=UPI00283C14DE|nr:Ig-like domain-containing protein [Paludisphaera borealis]MDR3622461.1 Ig-like domain-containing protein [Paludisphaera borealis]